MANRREESESSDRLSFFSDFIFLGSKITADSTVTAGIKLKDVCSLEGKL